MPTAYEAADQLNITHGTGPGEEPIATVARGLVSPGGTLVGSVNRAGHLVNADGTRLIPDARIFLEDFAAAGARADKVATIGAGGAVFATTTTLLHQVYTPGGNILAAYNIGVQTTPPAMATAGLDIAGVATAAIGIELALGVNGASGRPFPVGTSPAFYAKLHITPSDVSGISRLAFGFRRVQASALLVPSYTDYAAIGLIAGDIIIQTTTTGSSNTTEVDTDTTDNLADATQVILGVFVNAAGLVTYTINGVAPTVNYAYTFPDGTLVHPFISFIQNTDICDTLTIQKLDVGYQ